MLSPTIPPPLYIANVENSYITIHKAEYIGGYSIDGKGKFYNGSKNLKIINCQDIVTEKNEVDFDLNEEFEDRITKDIINLSKKKLYSLLQWIIMNKSLIYLSDKRRDRFFPDFVCGRGRISQILVTPYHRRDPWIMEATKYKGTIYISEIETNLAKARRQGMSSENKKLCSYGFKFEQFMAGEKGPVNENEEYNIVAKTTIGNHRILFQAEVDGANVSIKQQDEKEPSSYIELKTINEINSGKRVKKFEKFNSRKWWAQCAIAGIPEVICGFRTSDGLVKEIKSFPVCDLPKLGKGWNSDIMLSFLITYLDWIKDAVKLESPTVYEFRRDVKSPKIVCSAVEERPFFPPNYLESIFPSGIS